MTSPLDLVPKSGKDVSESGMETYEDDDAMLDSDAAGDGVGMAGGTGGRITFSNVGLEVGW
jgi:hypothetical protein